MVPPDAPDTSEPAKPSRFGKEAWRAAKIAATGMEGPAGAAAVSAAQAYTEKPAPQPFTPDKLPDNAFNRAVDKAGKHWDNFAKEDVGWLGLITLAAVILGLVTSIAWGNWLGVLIFSVGYFVTVIVSSRMKAEFFTLSGLAFILVLVLHGFLIYSDFKMGSLILAVGGLIVYVVISLALGGLNSSQRMRIIGAAVFSLLLYILPALVSLQTVERLFPSLVVNAVVFASTIFPFLALFILAEIAREHEGGYAHGLLLIYRVLIALFLLGFILAQFFTTSGSVLALLGNPSVDASHSFSKIWDKGIESYKTVYGKISGTVKEVQDPASYYRGQVEQNEKKPLGVTIENLRPIDPAVDNETPIVVYGTVQAKSFVASEMLIIPACVLDKGSDTYQAAVDPSTLDVVYGTSGSFECTFPPVAEKGTYDVKAYATFPFDTWAYIEYTFVDDERARNLARQGLDVRQELNIPEEPTATFTNGPITLGMGGTPQPVLVRLDKEPIISQGTRLGMTLESAWAKGKLDRVRALEFKVPKPFTLSDCDRGEPTRVEDDAQEPDLYTSYVFENPSFDLVATYTSLTCKLGLDDKEYATKLVSEGDKKVLTFIAVAHYTYTVHEETEVRVR